MTFALFFVDYFLWHYTRALRDLFVVWGNFFWFLQNYFSIRLLLRTLFSPFKRIKEPYRRGGIEDFLGSVVVNIMTRIIGAMVRLSILIFGFFALLLWIAFLGVVVVFWIIAPFVLVYLFLYGLALLLV